MATNRRMTAPRKPMKRKAAPKQTAPQIKPSAVPSIDVVRGRASPLIRDAFSRRLRVH